MAMLALSAAAQVVSNVNWELEGNERIVITYDLARLDDVIYFDVSVKVKIDETLVQAKAFSGDVGSYIKVGTNKKIVWNMFDDISALNGALSVEVIAVNPVPVTSAPAENESTTQVSEQFGKVPQQKIPFWAGMGGIAITGAALLTAGVKGAGEGQDLYDIYKTNTMEASSVYTELGTTRDDLYHEANKKYKNGTLLQAAGAAIFVAAGVMVVTRMIQSRKIQGRDIAVSPHLGIDPATASGRINVNTGLTLQYRIR
jgi:hypothetical protein